jgi:hypothetical protein
MGVLNRRIASQGLIGKDFGMLNRRCISVIVVMVGWGSSAMGQAQDPAGNRSLIGTDSTSAFPPSAAYWGDVMLPSPLTPPSSRGQTEFGEFPSPVATRVPAAPVQEGGRLDVAWNRTPNASRPALPPQWGQTVAPENAAGFAGTVRGRFMQKGQPVASCYVVILPMNNDGIDQNRLPLTTTTDNEGMYYFDNVPAGTYKLTWLPAGSTQWIRRIEMKPDVVVHAGQTVVLREIRMALQTIN